MDLTLKQEQFCQKVFSGMTYTAAYRASYNAQGMASKTVWEKASRLAHQGKVRARIYALGQPKRSILAQYEVQAAKKLCELVDAQEALYDDEGNIKGYKANQRLNFQAANTILNFMGYGKGRLQPSRYVEQWPLLTQTQVEETLQRLASQDNN